MHPTRHGGAFRPVQNQPQGLASRHTTLAPRETAPMGYPPHGALWEKLSNADPNQFVDRPVPYRTVSQRVNARGISRPVPVYPIPQEPQPQIIPAIQPPMMAAQPSSIPPGEIPVHPQRNLSSTNTTTLVPVPDTRDTSNEYTGSYMSRESVRALNMQHALENNSSFGHRQSSNGSVRLPKRYTCNFCGRWKASAANPKSIRLRCGCGGKGQDGIPRIHGMWSAVAVDSANVNGA